jgi:hypothetical protein
MTGSRKLAMALQVLLTGGLVAGMALAWSRWRYRPQSSCARAIT